MNRVQGFKLITVLSLRLPRPMLYRLAHLFSMMNYYLNRTQREAVHENLRVILGPEAPERRIRFEAKWLFKLYGRYLVEFFGLERFGKPFIDTHVDVFGREHIDAALAKGKGALLVTAHLSNWELGAAYLAAKGYPALGIGMVHPDEKLNELIARQRASRGYQVIQTEGAFRRAVRELRRNNVVCFAGDRDVGYGRTTVQFFGRPTVFPQGPARMALATGAELVPGFVIRRPGGHFAIMIEPPVPVPETGGRREKAHAMTQHFAGLVEKWVTLFPAQWGIFHRFWPDGEGVPAAGGVLG